jgi:benzoyl-CoA reductase/2-hydroxyglutaryl-CoA dehydratase subunit BcrC/BadD/HgdB
MHPVAYTSPFIPPEWITAHGFQPMWVPPGRLPTCQEKPDWQSAPRANRRGLCPYAGILMDEADEGIEASALVMATTCDQMRRAAELVETASRIPVFLLNVPATWQTPAARQYYAEELRRLGRFLVQLGGKAPSASELAGIMLQYDRARAALRCDAADWPARRRAEAVLGLRGVRQSLTRGQDARAPSGVPLALVGGPLLPQDHGLFDLIEAAGGRVVLDASETGERTLPRPLRHEAMQGDPFEELVAAYHAIPDAFRRPNDRLYEWLGREIEACGARGLLLRRYLWCDIWHAEWRRLKEWSPVPVLEIDVADDEPSVPNRTQGRLEAFLETLGPMTWS